MEPNGAYFRGVHLEGGPRSGDVVTGGDLAGRRKGIGKRALGHHGVATCWTWRNAAESLRQVGCPVRALAVGWNYLRVMLVVGRCWEDTDRLMVGNQSLILCGSLKRVYSMPKWIW